MAALCVLGAASKRLAVRMREQLAMGLYWRRDCLGDLAAGPITDPCALRFGPAPIPCSLSTTLNRNDVGKKPICFQLDYAITLTAKTLQFWPVEYSDKP